MIISLVYLAILLTLILIIQLMHIYQLSSEIRGKNIGMPDEKDNRSQSKRIILFAPCFFIFLVGLIWRFKNDMLSQAASDIGKASDSIFALNWAIVFIVFFITQSLLFYFAYRYKWSVKHTTAYYYPHNSKLEFIWTVVPIIALSVLGVYGLSLWGRITGNPSDSALNIQIYAKQFDFTVRYAGNDNKLGASDYKLIDDANNPLGMDSSDPKGWDDIVVHDELHMPVGREINIQCNARDVIHGIYLPHFREQINCVPGMSTFMHFTPIITTDSMRHQLHDTTFNYILLCNRVCGVGHYNMHLKVVVDTKEEFQKWLSSKVPRFEAINKRKRGGVKVTVK